MPVRAPGDREHDDLEREDGDAAVDAAEVGGADVSPGNPWYILTAQAISKVSSGVQRELLANKLMPYFVEWCRTESPRTKGVAYLDCAYLYDTDSKNVSFLHGRTPSQNIYLGFASTLLDAVDPVLRAAKERLQCTLEQTFWAIPQAFVFGQACQVVNCSMRSHQGIRKNVVVQLNCRLSMELSIFTFHLHFLMKEQCVENSVSEICG